MRLFLKHLYNFIEFLTLVRFCIMFANNISALLCSFFYPNNPLILLLVIVDNRLSNLRLIGPDTVNFIYYVCSSMSLSTLISIQIINMLIITHWRVLMIVINNNRHFPNVLCLILRFFNYPFLSFILLWFHLLNLKFWWCSASLSRWKIFLRYFNNLS